MTDERLFDSSHAALGSGKGLIGVDGAAQAGMIRRELSELPELHQAVLTARIAPRDVACDCGRPCCATRKGNPEWDAAISWLTDRAMQQLAGGFSHYRVRRSILEKIFGRRVDLQQIADDCGVHRNTVSDQSAKLKTWIEGPRGKHAKSDAAPGVESVAWIAIDVRLKDAMMVKIEEAA